jgi:hypothetical protein
LSPQGRGKKMLAINSKAHAHGRRLTHAMFLNGKSPWIFSEV